MQHSSLKAFSTLAGTSAQDLSASSPSESSDRAFDVRLMHEGSAGSNMLS